MTTKLILSLAREIGDERFSEYLEEKLVCPNTAVDRITPKQNYNLLGSYIESKYGAQDNCAVVCEEHFELIVQDNGRIPPKIVEAFSKAGATFVDDVTPYQDRKIRILNGGHMLFGLAGTIMQIQSVREAMHNPAARTLLDVFFEQVSSALAPIQPVNIAPFIQTTIGRFNNPHLTDQTSRLVAATTSKVPARLLNIEALKNGFPSDASAFAIAIWLRYLEQRDDSGNPYSLHEHDTHTIQRHGLDISNPALGKNLFTFLYQTDSGISPVVMSQFCEEIVTYAHTIKNLGLERSIKITFPQQVVQKPHKLPLYAAGY